MIEKNWQSELPRLLCSIPEEDPPPYQYDPYDLVEQYGLPAQEARPVAPPADPTLAQKVEKMEGVLRE